MRKRLLAVAMVFLVLATGSGDQAAPEASARAESAPAPLAPAIPLLRGDIDRILAESGLGQTVTAVRIAALADAASNRPAEVLYDLRSAQPLVPASTMKLFTTAACLDRLGKEWRIRTYIGRIPSAEKKGAWDLAVIGGGDPNFSGRFWGGDTVGAFRRWAAVLKARGVTTLGRIVLDDTLFDAVLQHPHWPPGQRAEWYEAPASALALNDNCMDIHVAPGRVGDPTRVWIDPPGDYVAVEGEILTVAGRRDHGFRLVRIVDEKSVPAVRIRASGRYWVGAGEALEYRTMADPTKVYGSVLADTLRGAGIAVAGPVVRGRLVGKDGRARADFVGDLVHASRLDTTIAVANKRSQGFYAECLLKILGAWAPTPQFAGVLPPRQGSWASGTEEVRRWMAERGIPTAGCVIDDGSGLSKENRLTALAVTELLRVMAERYGETFIQTLAVAGRDGSIRNRMRNTPAEGRVFGKTGYVAGVSALSGYVRTAGGRLLVYSILMNGFASGDLWRARLAQDKICLRLVDY